MAHAPTVVVRYDENGDPEFYASGDVRLLIVDERAPGDRVYSVTDRFTEEQIAEIVGDDVVGSRYDGSIAAQRLGQVGSN